MNKRNFFIGIVTAIALGLTIILFSIELTLIFKPLYYMDISTLNIEKDANMSREEIVKNYDYLITYTLDSKETQFKLPTLKSSEGAATHFFEVKKLFTLLNRVLFVSVIVSLIGFIYLQKKKFYKFYKWASIGLISFCIFLGLAFSINFDNTFVIFHHIFFRNSLWLFDPNTDPIINMLPETFFLHCGIMIATLIFLFSGLIFIKYRSTKKNWEHNIKL